ncbi:hypothetical protein [Altererythrobacter sp.]
MSSYRYSSSKPDRWSHPRPYSDASLRQMAHGRVLPMKQPGFFERLLGLA